MNALITLSTLVLAMGIIFVTPAYGAGALVVCAVSAAVAGLLISKTGSDKKFLLRLFIGGLLVRVLIGTVIFYFQLQEFFGGDANGYDLFGYYLLKGWQGDKYYESLVTGFIGGSGAGGWGMVYMVGGVYAIIGRNMLAIQFINAVLGAATAPIIFLCAKQLFSNIRVARYAGYFAAFYPSLVLWSSQALKDGPIVFLLALSMLATLRLGEKLSVKHLVVLCLSLAGLLSLRFYIFYMAVAAIGGSLLIGMRQASSGGILQKLLVVGGIGLGLTYLGVLQTATVQFEQFGDLDVVQRSRMDMAHSAETGFGQDVDVSTTAGAISAIPIGMTYLLFAPFPWQLANLRQSITLPEMLIWWASFPFLILGLWFTIRYRLRQALPILTFTAMLTLAYSIFQGNVGTAYRQRSQLLVFYFIFVSIGYVLLKERLEERRQQQALLSKPVSPLPGRRKEHA